MTDESAMIRRAADAILDDIGYVGCGNGDLGPAGLARAALLAALDPEDEELVCACAIQFGIIDPPRQEHQQMVRNVLSALRTAAAQGGPT